MVELRQVESVEMAVEVEQLNAVELLAQAGSSLIDAVEVLEDAGDSLADTGVGL